MFLILAFFNTFSLIPHVCPKLISGNWIIDSKRPIGAGAGQALWKELEVLVFYQLLRPVRNLPVVESIIISNFSSGFES